MSEVNGIRQIEAEGRHGECTGYSLDASRAQLLKYLAQFTYRSTVIAHLVRENCQQVAILGGLYVEEGSRGQGHGAALLKRFLAEVVDEGCEAVLLVADASQAQRPGFSLPDFYQGFGFVPVCETTAGPLMVYPEDIGLELQESLERHSAPSRVQAMSPNEHPAASDY